MLKKNIKYSFEHFELTSITNKSAGVSIIHYVNEDNEAQTMIGYYPKKIIHQTMVVIHNPFIILFNNH